MTGFVLLYVLPVRMLLQCLHRLSLSIGMALARPIIFVNLQTNDMLWLARIYLLS